MFIHIFYLFGSNEVAVAVKYECGETKKTSSNVYVQSNLTFRCLFMFRFDYIF